MDKLKKYFYLDLRSLAVFRIGLGIVILCDLLSRTQHMEAFYTDFGTLPRWIAIEKYNHFLNFSFHYLGGHIGFQYLIFFIHGLFALGLIIGFRTKLMTFLCWLLAVSLQNRNSSILNSGDVVLRMVLFWGMFLPLGFRYSVDRALDISRQSMNQYCSLSSFALITQLFFIYVFTGLLKHSPLWFPKGEALAMAMELDIFVTPLGVYLRNFPELMKFMTLSVYFMEVIGFLIFFIPFKTNLFRLAGVLMFASFHLGIILTMNIGAFPWTCIMAWLALLPSSVWDYLEVKLKSFNGQGCSLYYDQDCGFCKKSVSLIKEFFLLSKMEILPSQSDKVATKIMDQETSWAFKNSSGNAFSRFSAFVEIVQVSVFAKLLVPILKLSVVDSFGSKSYHYVSHNRKKISSLTEGFKWRELDFKRSKLITFLLIFLISYSFVQNFSTLPKKYKFGFDNLKISSSLRPLLGLIRIDQKWSMFAPYPLRDDGWLVIEGKDVAGNPINLWNTNAKNPFEKPSYVAKSYLDTRWRKYLGNLWQKKHQKHRLYFGRYICRKYNKGRRGNSRLYTFKIHYMLERTNIHRPMQVEKKTIWDHRCF